MKTDTRVHIAINVANFEHGRKFYSDLLGHPPNRVAEDQLDWILNNPPIHLSIYSNRTYKLGVEHIGFDMSTAELAEFRDRTALQGSAINDPDGLKIEFYTSEFSQ